MLPYVLLSSCAVSCSCFCAMRALLVRACSFTVTYLLSSSAHVWLIAMYSPLLCSRRGCLHAGAAGLCNQGEGSAADHP
jgi:hypothetical protein